MASGRRGGGGGGGGGAKGLFAPIEQWLRSRTRHPRYRHIFRGDVNMGARPTPRGSGFHHRFLGENPPGARVRTHPDTGRELILATGSNGTYRARVDVQGPDGQWYPKRGSSTFFPDGWTPQRVDATIQDAFRDRTPHPSDPDKWTGLANGVVVEGFYDASGQHWYSAWPNLG